MAPNVMPKAPHPAGCDLLAQDRQIQLERHIVGLIQCAESGFGHDLDAEILQVQVILVQIKRIVVVLAMVPLGLCLVTDRLRGTLGNGID